MRLYLVPLFLISVVDGANNRPTRQGLVAKQAPSRCIYPNGDLGVCVTADKCPQIKAVIDSQLQSQAVAKFLEKFQCGSQGGSSRVCCPDISPLDQDRTSSLPKIESCKDPLGKSGVCAAIRKCPSGLHLVINHRKHKEAVRFLRNAFCGVEDEEPKICCHDDSAELEMLREDSKPQDSRKTRPTITLAKPPKRKPVVGSSKPLNLQTSKLPGSEHCGRRDDFDFGIVHVTNGANVTTGEWPWMAALGYKPNQGTKPVFLCGGTLITNQHVLTAAHCVSSKKRKLILARLGDLNLYEDTDGAVPNDVRIAKIIMHENYNETEQTNDIAILVLDRSVQFSGNIRPICLPITQELQNKERTDEYLQVAGWGASFSNGPNSATLQDAVVQFVPENVCENAYKEFNKVIDNRVLCAGNLLEGSSDTCTGDSGGPIMDGDETFYQIGIVSYGYDCGKLGYPGVYTKVAHYLEWIYHKVEITLNRRF